jgi:hypothetical protein
MGQRLMAVRTCFSKVYSKPARVVGSRRQLTKISGAGADPRIASHARSALVVSFQSGSERSRRPLPWMRTLEPAATPSSSTAPASTLGPADRIHHPPDPDPHLSARNPGLNPETQ